MPFIKSVNEIKWKYVLCCSGGRNDLDEQWICTFLSQYSLIPKGLQKFHCDEDLHNVIPRQWDLNVIIFAISLKKEHESTCCSHCRSAVPVAAVRSFLPYHSRISITRWSLSSSFPHCLAGSGRSGSQVCSIRHIKSCKCWIAALHSCFDTD